MILAIPLDIFISQKLKTNHDSPGELEVWYDIYHSNINANIAIYGSSRAWVQLDPAIFEDSLGLHTYNFGMDGQNIRLQYLRHSEYFKNNSAPETIILSLDVFTLAKRKDLFQLDQFLPYMLWNPTIYEYTKSYQGFNKSDYFVPLIRYFGRTDALTKAFSANSDEKFRYNGFRGRDSEWNNDLENAQNYNKDFSISIDSPSVKLFEQLISDLINQKINLIFVYTPEYIEGQAFVKNREEIMSLFHSFSSKYSIPFFDYSTDIISQQKEFFYNASHLNKTGAELFTQKFVSDLKKHKQTHSVFPL